MRPSAILDNADEFNGATKRRCNYNNDFMGKKTVDGHGHATIDCEADGWRFLQPARRGFIFGPMGTTSILRRVTERSQDFSHSDMVHLTVHRGRDGGGIAVWGSSPTLC